MNSNLPSISRIYGKWHIVYSDFPMWTSGTRVSPSLNYAHLDGDGESEYFIRDIVMFTKNGKPRTIAGKNKVLNEQELKFMWKGKGLLSLLRSRWQIIHFKENWMIIKFEKTLFTPQGYDVAVRNIDLKNTKKDEIQDCLNKLGIPSLLPIPHQEGL